MTGDLRAWSLANRRALVALAASLLLGYFGGAILGQQQRTAVVELQRSQADLDRCLELAAAVRRLAPKSTPSAGGASVNQAGGSLSLMTLVEQGAKRHDLDKALKRMQPVDEDHLELVLQAARFDDLVLWFGQLQMEAEVGVVRATISRGDTDAPGLVDANVTLSR